MESRIRCNSKRMDTNQPKVEANILLLGAENVGKSGELLCFIYICYEILKGCNICIMLLHAFWTNCNPYYFFFLALIVRFLTRRFIGEYGSIGKQHKTPCDPSGKPLQIEISSGFSLGPIIKKCISFLQSPYTVIMIRLMAEISASTSGSHFVHR